jgi:hypothetical protein
MMPPLVQASGADPSHHDGVARGLHLPLIPEAVELEIELTNICNASCCVCPRSDMPASGILQADTLERILDLYVELRERHSLNRTLAGAAYPRLTVAGGGEPMLHPHAIAMLARMVERGFPVHLITNASRISERRLEPLLATGISSIAVSFWGIVAEEYEKAMRLPFAPTLERVERLAEAARHAGVHLVVTWVATPEVRSTPAEIQAFWAARGIEVEVADNDAWNRGGLVQIGAPFFTDAWTWQGDCVLCCCNYFTSSRVVLGNIRTHDLRDIAAVKEEILRRRPLPSMCTVCEQPRRSQSTWLAEPWLPLLAPEERAMVTYDPTWQPPAGSVET